MFKLVPRKEPNRTMLYATPFLAVLLTLVAGFLLFTVLGKDPLHAMYLIFLKPLTGLQQPRRDAGEGDAAVC